MRVMSVLLIVGCGTSTPSAPIHNTKRDSLSDQVKSERVVLYDKKTIATLDAQLDPRELMGVEGFVVDIARTSDGWEGTVGVVPLVGCCLEPVVVSEPKLEGADWRIRTRGDSGLWACGGATELQLHPRSDGDYDAVCGEHRTVLAHGKSIDARKAEWERARVDELFATIADPRLKRAGKSWTFEGNALGRCAVLARACDLTKLVPSCVVEGQLVRTRDGKLEVTKAETPFADAKQCVKGALPGID